VSRVLSPLTLNGVRYRVLRLDGSGNLRFLLRSDTGELFGVYRRNAQPALSAAPLKLTLSADNPFREVDLFETEGGGLVVRDGGA
jgi:hypothetical protein